MLREYIYLANIFNVLVQNQPSTQSSHHLPVHGDDVSNEGTFLHGRDMSVGDTIGQRVLRAAGHYSTGTPIGDEDRLAGWTLITCAAVGDRGDVCQWGIWRGATGESCWLEVAPGKRTGERAEKGREWTHPLASASSLMWVNRAQESRKRTGSHLRTAGPSGYPGGSSETKDVDVSL